MTIPFFIVIIFHAFLLCRCFIFIFFLLSRHLILFQPFFSSYLYTFFLKFESLNGLSSCFSVLMFFFLLSDDSKEPWEDLISSVTITRLEYHVVLVESFSISSIWSGYFSFIFSQLIKRMMELVRSFSLTRFYLSL